jgi:hypothetical protein
MPKGSALRGYDSSKFADYIRKWEMKAKVGKKLENAGELTYGTGTHN